VGKKGAPENPSPPPIIINRKERINFLITHLKI